MAQNSKEPQGFAGFDDLISEVSEDIPSLLSTAKPAKSQPATQRVSHDASQLQGFEGFNALISEISVPEERVTPPPKTTPIAPPSVPPPRNDPPKPPTAQLPVPVKSETRVMVEPKPVPSALPQPPGAGSHKAAWFFGICGIIFILWIFSGTETNQTSRGPASSRSTPSVSATTQSTPIAKSEPAYRPVTPAITVPTKPALNPTTNQVSPPVATTKPAPPKPQSDPLVKEIQSRLLALGYSPGVADGYAGQKTFNAIKQFQKDNQLFIDPTISKELLANLNSAQPRIIPKRAREPSLNRSASNENKESICPVGKICVNVSPESLSSHSENDQTSANNNQYYKNNQSDYNSSRRQSNNEPTSSNFGHQKTRIVCPTAIFCYPQPY